VAVTHVDGIWRYASYTARDRLFSWLRQRGQLTMPDENPIDWSGLPPMVDQLTEMRTYIGLACSDIPLRGLVHLAVSMPEVTVHAVAAGLTFTAPPAYMRLLATTLPEVRSAGEAPFEYHIEPEAWHSSYDNLTRFTGHVAATIALTDQYRASQSGATQQSRRDVR